MKDAHIHNGPSRSLSLLTRQPLYFTLTNLIKARRSRSHAMVPWDLQIFWQFQTDASRACVSEFLLHAGGGGVLPHSFRCCSCFQHHPHGELRLSHITTGSALISHPLPWGYLWISQIRTPSSSCKEVMSDACPCWHSRGCFTNVECSVR